MTADTLTPAPLERSEYWHEARQPLVCLAFLAPLLLLYEAGVWLCGNPATVRNGADFWLRDRLGLTDFAMGLLVPAVLVVGLIVWQLASKKPWRVHIDTLLGMLAESLLFAFFLVLLGQCLYLGVQRAAEEAALAISLRPAAQLIVTFVGAGIYEEVLFRAILLPVCYGAFRASKLGKRHSAVLAILVSSLAFSAAHYIGASGDDFAILSFAFRSLAGGFFAVLFCLRGVGVTVGCHAAYDIVVGILL